MSRKETERERPVARDKVDPKSLFFPLPRPMFDQWSEFDRDGIPENESCVRFHERKANGERWVHWADSIMCREDLHIVNDVIVVEIDGPMPGSPKIVTFPGTLPQHQFWQTTEITVSAKSLKLTKRTVVRQIDYLMKHHMDKLNDYFCEMIQVARSVVTTKDGNVYKVRMTQADGLFGMEKAQMDSDEQATFSDFGGEDSEDDNILNEEPERKEDDVEELEAENSYSDDDGDFDQENDLDEETDFDEENQSCDDRWSTASGISCARSEPWKTGGTKWADFCLQFESPDDRDHDFDQEDYSNDEEEGDLSEEDDEHFDDRSSTASVSNYPELVGQEMVEPDGPSNFDDCRMDDRNDQGPSTSHMDEED